MSVIIIAEAGVNHNGSIEKAKKLIDIADDAGADFVKFQTFSADKLVTAKAKKANYQLLNTKNADEGQYDMLQKLELSKDNHDELIKYCKHKNINFLSSAFDEDALVYLNSLDIDLFKIPSGEITNLPYLEKVASFRKPVILSSGMSNLSEIKNALDVLIANGLSKNDITVLHCNTEYPTPMKDVNLKAMNTIKEFLEVKVGYSDHTKGIEVAIAAVSMGAVVIEKHFTIDNNLPGPDHLASLEPNELKEMIISIRNVEIAISGNGKKELSESEKKNISIVRKSIYYKNSLIKGNEINNDNLIFLRPGNGISPMRINEIIGKVLIRDVSKFDKVSLNDFK